MKKFGILYICTGKYDVFWKEFYESCEKNLLINCDIEKHYFVWTDSGKIKGNDRIHIFYQENLGRPDNTLKRFHMFLSQEKELEKMDYIFFFNANLEIKMPIGEEILPKNNDMIVVVIKHTRYFNRNNLEYGYDRNPKSTAYIKKGEGTYYVQGGLNGGTKYSFFKMCRALAKNIDVDENKGVVAKWHDESHLNRYVYDLEMNGFREKFMILPPSFLFIENSTTSFPCKILIRDKSRYLNVWEIKKTNAGLKEYCIFLIKSIMKIFSKR